MKILTLNTWLLPPPFAKDNTSRLESIIAMIQDESPDVFGLQEVWVNAYVRKLRSALPEYELHTASDAFLFNRSGLVFGSKRSVSKYRYDTFPDTKEHNIEEKLAGNGWQCVKLEDCAILHTHLYASKNDPEYRMTGAQLQMLESVDFPQNTILVGDLNLPKDLFCEYTSRFRCPKESEHTIVSTNPYADARLNYPSDGKWSYITPTTTAEITCDTHVRKEPILSDHYALIGDVTIN